MDLLGGKMSSLSDKEYEGRGIKKWYKKEDVKKPIKELIDFCNIHKGTLIVADALKKIMIKEFGKELSSEVEK